ncbi:MAG: tRNA 2-thiouridine(34) synthase MnmA, partial [Acidobacteria bacterium]|nr:tRNA 2-thiouridine(34) synthase MnmA [Acidobacteriota bacterium]
ADAEKPESQEICFVPTGNYAEFIEAYLHEQGSDAAETEGEIVTTNGEVIGHHSGLHHYTVGQRRGLGLAAGRPLYVVSLDTAGNRLVVGDDADLARDTCDVRDVNWIPFEKPQGPLEAQVKIRHRHEPADAVVEPLEESAKLGCHPEDVPQQRDGRRISSVRVRFHTPQRAVTPGQAAVFYSGDLVLGGGWIL